MPNTERGFLFLTGATGHTGSRVARRLLGDGWRLRCLVHTPEHAVHLPKDERLEVVPGDVDRPETWQDRLAGASALLHMAHIRFADAVVRACEAAGVARVIALSSTRRFTRFPEQTARWVIDGEARLEASTLDYTILRASMIFGGDRDNNLEKVVRWLQRRRWVPVVAGGHHQVQPIFVGDLVEAIVRALERPEATRRRALTVAGPEPISQRRLIAMVGKAIGRPPVFINMPYAVVLTGAALVALVPGRKWLSPAQVRRQLEDKTFDIAEAMEALGGWHPRPYAEALAMKARGEA